MTVTIDLCEYTTNKALRNVLWNHSLIPIMTSNTAPSGVASSSDNVDGTRIAYRAFDHQLDDLTYCWHSSSSAYPHWLKYQFPQAEVVGYYSLRWRLNNQSITAWKLQGSNNDSDWTDLDTQTGQSLSSETFYSVSSPAPYIYYRLYCTAGNNGNYAIVGELRFYSSTPKIKGVQSPMTADNAPSPQVASASAVEYSSSAFRAFQNYENLPAAADAWVAATTTGWLKLDFGSGNGKVITSYSFIPQNYSDGPNRAPKNWTIQGSNDDSSWDTLHTVTGEASWGQTEERYFSFTNTTSYRYYKIDITLNNGSGNVAIGRLFLYDGSVLPIQPSVESSIKDEGSYSIKLNISTDALNKSIHFNITPVDLSGQDSITFKVRASRTGSNLKFGFLDSGGTLTEVTPNITSADTFQTVTLDISGVADANKDSISRIFITCLDADSANTVYLDNIVGETTLDLSLSVDSGSISLAGTAINLKATRKLATVTGGITLSGTAVELKSYKLACVSGSIAVSGTSVELKSYKLACASGSITLSGTSVSLKYSKLVCTSGSISLSGTAVDVKATRKLAIASGSITLSGTTVELKSYKLVCTSGIINLSGTGISLKASHLPLAATSGAISLSGTAVSFARTYNLIYVSGTINLSGTNTNLLKNYKLSCISGTVTLSGTDVGLTKLRDIDLEVAAGSFTIAGQSVTLKVSMPAVSGSIVLVGTAVGTLYGHKLKADYGELTLSGTSITLKVAIPVVSGNVSLTGTAVDIICDRTLSVSHGELTLSGSSVTTLKNYRLYATTLALTFTGTNVDTLSTRKLSTISGSFIITGKTLTFGTGMPATVMSVTLSGTNIELRSTRKLSLSSGVLTINGTTVNVIVNRKLGTSSGTISLAGMSVALKNTRKLSIASKSLTLASDYIALLHKVKVVTYDNPYILQYIRPTSEVIIPVVTQDDSTTNPYKMEYRRL